MEKIFNAHKMKERRQLLRNRATIAEKRLWEYLSKSQFDGIKFRRQASIGHFVVDFYAPSIKLVIEIDGDSHCSPDAQEYDQDRTVSIESLGLTVIRFTNNEITDDLEGVLERLRARCTASVSPPFEGGV